MRVVISRVRTYLSRHRGKVSLFTVLGLLSIAFAVDQFMKSNQQNAAIAFVIGVGLIIVGFSD